ncbi:MAG: peptidoglycan DL-endopeptidase CwlO [Miltoncostaeaceae bacterium]|jgi:cell wall-associated NlpC family hydrolase|nr:peptidoglycan DL-endopeptidase CwlO [Miltoncostaeaceae bacterium]
MEVMRPLACLLAACAVMAPAAVATAAPAPADKPPADKPATVHRGPDDWARPAAVRLSRSLDWPQLRTVSLARPATRGALERALGALSSTGQTDFRVLAAPAVPGSSSAGITLAGARRAFVRAMGLESERRAIQSLSTEDGKTLRMPRDAGSEVLARELGLVVNLPQPLENLERQASQPLRYADLVSMADAASRVDFWHLSQVARYADIVLPAMSPAQFRVVQTAVKEIGSPYVWGGEWPSTTSPFGFQPAGGFDCSGLVWWSFSGPDDMRRSDLGDGLGWRTTADDIAFSSTAGKRVKIADTRAGDLVFFGARGKKTKRGHIEHVGIALGGGWMIHSSGSRGGVSISNLETYWTDGTAFARRPPAFAGAGAEKPV